MVAVCDILGYSNLVKSCSLEALRDFHQKNIDIIMKSSIPDFGSNAETSHKNETSNRDSVGHTVFSDTIILFSLSDDLYGYRNVLNAVYRLISKPMFTPIYRYRVGISYGEFYHNSKNRTYIGKAIVEANDLEKIQQWSGASLTEAAAKKFEGIYPESDIIANYAVPIKTTSKTSHKNFHVVNWTKASHEPKPAKQGWMYREENKVKVEKYSSKEVEQKILNTEKFHTDTCVRCKDVRK